MSATTIRDLSSVVVRNINFLRAAQILGAYALACFSLLTPTIADDLTQPVHESTAVSAKTFTVLLNDGNTITGDSETASIQFKSSLTTVEVPVAQMSRWTNDSITLRDGSTLKGATLSPSFSVRIAGVLVELEFQKIRSITSNTAAPLPNEAAPPVARKHPSKEAWENSLGMKFVPVRNLPILVSIWETRVQDFQAFADAVDLRQPANEAYGWTEKGWKQSGVDWKNPGFAQGKDHPVTCVNLFEAQRFCEWLTAKERAEGVIGPNQFYRLPTDAEWSTAVGLPREVGATPRQKDQKAKSYPWGAGYPPPSGSGNYADRSSGFPNTIAGYDDRFAHTSPVGSFQPTASGLFDLGGNVYEWCQDKFDPALPQHVIRGAAFAYGQPELLLSSSRNGWPPQTRMTVIGFRCVLAVGSGSDSKSTSLPTSDEPPDTSESPGDNTVESTLSAKFRPGTEITEGVVLLTIKQISSIEVTKRGKPFKDQRFGLAHPFKVLIRGTGINRNTNFGKTERFEIEKEAYFYQDAFSEWQVVVK